MHTDLLRRRVLQACVALPLLMLAANVLAWLRWGTDLPYFDDWRAYDMGNALSLAPGRLFKSVNNTISPVGMALEALAQRWLGGNPLPYQTLSMLGVLGGLLLMQWRLLGWVVGDQRLRALLFAFCFLMLQPGSYWGEQNLAYHQALPLVALLGAACLMVRPGWPHGGWWLMVFALGVAGGLSYISGAVAALVMGATWMAMAWLLRPHSARALAARLRVGGGALLLAGMATSALQIYLTRGVEQARVRQYMGLTWPDSADFWLYLAGKLGRSVGEGFASTAAEVTLVAALVLALLATTAFAFRGLLEAGRPDSARQRRFAVVFLPLGCMVAAYLVLVGLGRAGLRDASVQGLEAVFRFGYTRFHYFWITLLLPWLAVALALVLRRSRPMAGVLVAALVLTCLLGWSRGVFDIARYYRLVSESRETEIRCLARQLGSGKPIVCPGFSLMWLPDLTRAYIYARDIRASFVRYLPIVERQSFGQELLHWSAPEIGRRGRWVNVVPEPGDWLQSAGDAAFVLPLPDLRIGQCQTLGIQLGLETEQDGVTQIFYRGRGQSGYTEAQSVRRPFQPDAHGRVWMEFSIDSPDGFEPELRVDPVEAPVRFRLTDLRVTCRLSAAP
ncbi:hypothetical protein [Ottowia sp.]|uniref:hypothetical protein n=1 Tax=Ottowia sp. TaxID=1898956 RepID=UPI0026207FF8|nr:hypothetical protein [Ottowia sp.]